MMMTRLCLALVCSRLGVLFNTVAHKLADRYL
jgi:hypothetical protein